MQLMDKELVNNEINWWRMELIEEELMNNGINTGRTDE